MSETVHASFTFADFRLESGEVLPEATIAYCTRGSLAALVAAVSQSKSRAVSR